MRRRSRALALTLESVLLAGCATSALDMAPARPDKPWSPAVSATGEIIPGAKPLPAPVGEATYELPVNSKLANVPAPPELDRDQPYSLPELIDIAQSSNPLTRTAWNRAREAALAAGIARSAYLPSLTAGAALVYQRIDQDTLQGSISTLALQWLLFDFGQRKALNNVAKQASVISNIAFTAAHQQLIYEVSLAFYAHGAARARVATAAQSLQNARDVQAAAEERYAHGVGTVVEVAQARQATAQAQLLEVQAEGAARDAYLTLITAMGISPLTQIRIADTSGRKLPVATTASIEQIVAEAVGRRPDVLKAYATQVVSAESARAAKAEFLPKFFLVATAAYNQGNLQITAVPGIGQQAATVNVSQNLRNYTLFAGFTVPLYDAGMRVAALRQAQAKADSAALVLAHTQEEAVRQIVAAENALRTSLAANDASSSLVSAAQTTFEAAFEAYRNDVGSITEVTLAETQLLQARNASTDAYSAALSAAATLALAAGALGSAPR
jgi:outer membrane protein